MSALCPLWGSIAATEKPIDETVILRDKDMGFFLNNENKNCFALRMVGKKYFQKILVG
jgi:hypothetical protein